MRRIKLATLLGGLMVLASTSLVSAQAYGTPFATSVTYQNVGAAEAQVQFNFYNEKTGTPVTVNRTIAAGAGSSLFVGGLGPGETLPTGFKGSAVLSSNQPIVATLVQIPQPADGPVRNRPLSNGFREASSNVLLATVLKNQFNFNSIFSIQNAEATNAIDIEVRLVPVSGPTITIAETNIPAGSAKYYDMGTLGQVTPASFNGSATVTAVRTGTQTPANIVGSVIEQQTNGVGTYAFEGVTGGASKIFVATALCDVFGGNRTSYAVQNVDPTNNANITVSYQGINNVTQAPASGQASAQNLAPGAKQSFVACDAGVGAEFTGAATIESNTPIVVIAKVFGTTRGTAWLGEAQGSAQLALPYVRYSSNENFLNNSRQRTFIAIQNVGTAAVTGARVEYRDKNGGLVGTHNLPSIAPGAKVNTNATLATGDAAKLLDFGNPEANPGGGFGGAAIVVGPAGSQLIAVARVESSTTAGPVAEDYNGIAIQ